MHRPNYRSPNPCGSGGGGSPGSFRSPGPMTASGSGSPMLPPPLPPWGYGSPHTPTYGQRPSRPYGSGGSSPSQNSYGGWYGGQSPGSTPPRRPSPRYNVSPYSKSPGGGNPHHYQQHNARGFSSPRHPANYQVIGREGRKAASSGLMSSYQIVQHSAMLRTLHLTQL